MEISMDWTPLLTISWPIHKGLPLAVFPSPKLHESAPEAFARRNNGTARGCRTEGKQLENFPSFQQNWLKNDTHTHTYTYPNISSHEFFQKLANSFMFGGNFRIFFKNRNHVELKNTILALFHITSPPRKPGALPSLIKSCVGESSNQICTLFEQKRDDIVCIYIYVCTMGTHNLHFSGLWPIYLGPKTFIFHGFGVQRYTVMYMWYWHLFGMTNTFWFRKLHSKKPTTYLHGKRKNHLKKSALEGDTLVPGRVIELEIIPSRELTYLPQNGILKMIFLFPRWDMLIPWRVCHWTGNHSSFLGGRKHFPIPSHQLSVETLE